MGERPRSTDNFKIDVELGGPTPTLLVELPARPVDPDEEVEKVVVVFHVTLKDLWP